MRWYLFVVSPIFIHLSLTDYLVCLDTCKDAARSAVRCVGFDIAPFQKLSGACLYLHDNHPSSGLLIKELLRLGLPFNVSGGQVVDRVTDCPELQIG